MFKLSPFYWNYCFFLLHGRRDKFADLTFIFFVFMFKMWPFYCHFCFLFLYVGRGDASVGCFPTCPATTTWWAGIPAARPYLRAARKRVVAAYQRCSAWRPSGLLQVNIKREKEVLRWIHIRKTWTILATLLTSHARRTASYPKHKHYKQIDCVRWYSLVSVGAENFFDPYLFIHLFETHFSVKLLHTKIIIQRLNI